MVSTALFDALAAGLLLAIALTGAYAPVFLHKKGGRSLAYVLGNMLSAGVMISAGLVHLLGAAMQDLNSMEFPLAPFLCGLGFILTLLADQAATILTAKHGWEITGCSAPAAETQLTPLRSTPKDDPKTDHHDDVESGFANGRVDSFPSKNSANGGRLIAADGTISQDVHGHLKERQRDSPREVDGHRSEFGKGDPGDMADQPLVPRGAANSSTAQPPADAVVTPRVGSKVEALARSLSKEAPVLPQISFITAVLMATALCFHSILEGMAMGAQKDTVDSFHIFIAILAHKGLAAYALGSSILESGASTARFWIVVGIFAGASPVGIGFGRLVVNLAEGGPAAALSALASGTFLYVAFMEVIPKEMASPEHGLGKLGVLLLGFGAMSLLAIWA